MLMVAAIYVIQYVNNLFFTFKFFVWFVMLLTKNHAGKASLIPICSKWEAGIIYLSFIVARILILFDYHIYLR